MMCSQYWSLMLYCLHGKVSSSCTERISCVARMQTADPFPPRCLQLRACMQFPRRTLCRTFLEM